MAKISFLASDGCQFSGISGLIDSLGIASLANTHSSGGKTDPIFKTEILTPDGKPFQTSAGFEIRPDASMADIRQTDMIIIPPFLPNAEFLSATSKNMLDWIVERYEDGIPVAALCTGTFVLAETGLLNGRMATTNWLYAKLFRQRFPKVILRPDRILTHDKGLICSGAVSAFFNLGLYIIETFGSRELASRCSKIFLVEPGRDSQASYAIFNVLKEHGDEGIRKAQQWMEYHLTENISMENLASEVGISQRHFIRRFRNATGESPLNYLQRIKIEKAKDMLENRRDTIDEITRNIGYEDSSAFRKVFRKYTGLSPREYRDKFTRRNIAGKSPGKDH